MLNSRWSVFSMLLMCIAFKFYCVLLALAVSILRYLAFRGGEWSVVSVAGLSLLAGATSGLYYSLSSSEVPDQLGLVCCCKHVSFFPVDWAACTCCKKPRDLLCFRCITFLCFSHSRVVLLNDRKSLDEQQYGCQRLYHGFVINPTLPYGSFHGRSVAQCSFYVLAVLL